MVVSPSDLTQMLHDPLGKKLVMAGIACLTLGNICIRKLVQIRA